MIDETIQRRKLSDAVSERLLKLIETGELGPGSELPSERELMARYGVGRPAVREAMQRLEGMRLISIQHGERSRVVALTPRSMLKQIHLATRHMLATSPGALEYLKEARQMFEVGMVRRAAQVATPADLEQLWQAIGEMRASIAEPKRFVAADMRFHNLLAQVSGNPILHAVSEAMLQWLFEFHTELVRLPGNEDVTVCDHQEIYERVAARDGEGAARAMIDHLTRINARKQRSLRRPATRRRTEPVPTEIAGGGRKESKHEATGAGASGSWSGPRSGHQSDAS